MRLSSKSPIHHRVVIQKPLPIYQKVIERIGVPVQRQTFITTNTTNLSTVSSAKNLHEISHYETCNSDRTYRDQHLIEINSWRQKYQVLEQQYMDLLNSLNQQDPNSGSRHDLLIQENQRLNQIIKDKLQEIETLEVRISQLTNENAQLQHNLRESERMRNLLMMQNQQTHNDSRYDALMKENQRTNQTLREKISELENAHLTITQLQMENSRLQAQLKDLERFRNQVNSRYTEVQETTIMRAMNHDIDQPRMINSNPLHNSSEFIAYEKYQELLNINTQLNDQVQDLQQELKRITHEYNLIITTETVTQELNSNLESLLEQLRQLQKENGILQKEITRLEKVEVELTDELNQFKFSYASQNSLNHKLQELLTVIVLLQVEIESLRTKVLNKDEEIQDLRNSQIAQFKR